MSLMLSSFCTFSFFLEPDADAAGCFIVDMDTATGAAGSAAGFFSATLAAGTSGAAVVAVAAVAAEAADVLLAPPRRNGIPAPAGLGAGEAIGNANPGVALGGEGLGVSIASDGAGVLVAGCCISIAANGSSPPYVSNRSIASADSENG